MRGAFPRTVRDLLGSGEIRLLRLDLQDMPAVVDASRAFNLDFDNAYQYVAAEKHNLTLVGFDSNLDRTERGRTTPGAVLAGGEGGGG